MSFQLNWTWKLLYL